MNFELSDEQRMLVDGSQRYIRERYSLESRRSAARTDDGFSREHWQSFAELGWLGLPIPEAFGGLGGSPVDVALLAEQLGAGLVAEPLIDSSVLCGTLLTYAPASVERDRLFGELVTGETLLSLAHLEPGGRCEYDSPIATRALECIDGWRLEGVKQRVFHGASADRLLVTARLGDSAEAGLFVLDPRDSNVTLNRYEIIDGTRAADLQLKQPTVTHDALLLRGPALTEALDAAFDAAVLAMSAAAIGSMDTVMTMTAEYLKTRQQYGQPLAKFQALQHRMSEMFIETDQARSILYRALAIVSAGDRVASGRAISAMKSLVSRACRFVTGQGIQLHGGIGTTEEYAVGHHYRAMLVYEHRFGDGVFHLDRSAGLSASA